MIEHALVTGGLGFIGRHLVDYLRSQGSRVRILDIATSELAPWDDVEIYQGSVTDPVTVKGSLEGIDTVFHLAANAQLWARDKQVFNQVNYRGSCSVFKACLDTGVKRVVHTSTEAVLTSCRRRIPAPVTEAVNLTLEDMAGAYCESKWLAEQAALEYVQKGVPIVIVNPTLPIGPGDTQLTPPTRMVLGYLKGEYPAFVESHFNFIDVRDLAQGHYLAALNGNVGERYILGHTNIRLSEFLRILESLTGSPMPQQRIPYLLAWVVSIVQETWADYVTHQPPDAPLTGVKLAWGSLPFSNAKAIQELGLTCRPLPESLSDAIYWYRTQGLS